MSVQASDVYTENGCINVMFCYNCQMYLKKAVTGTCGHSRCDNCDLLRPRCPCGNDLGAFDRDYLVTSLLEQRNTIETTLWTMLEAFLMPPEEDCLEKDYSQLIAAAGNTTRLEINDSIDVIFNNKGRVVLSQYLCWLKLYPQELLNVLYIAYKHRCQLWVSAGFLDCSICSKLFYRPVTTPCGHTFCRECLERVFDYAYRCPYCQLELDDFNIDAIHDNIFLSSVIQLSGALIGISEPQQSNDIYALECDAKFPSTPSCFLTTMSNQKFMYRQCSRSRLRMFALINNNSRQSLGTLMLLTDIIKYRDGNLIVTAYGIQRIVIQHVTRSEGCLVIKFRPWADIVLDPSRPHYLLVEALCLIWFRSLHPDDQSQAVQLFGPMYSTMPEMDGPQWLWWMANVMPLCDVLRENFINLNIMGRCAIIFFAVHAWNEFPGPKRFADIERSRLRLTLIRNHRDWIIRLE